MDKEELLENLKALGLNLTFFKNKYGPEGVLIETQSGDLHYVQKESLLRKVKTGLKEGKLNLPYILLGSSLTRPSVNYPNYWYVTECGVLLSKRTSIVMRQTKSKTGYWTVASKLGGRNGKDVCVKVHREVAFVFVDNPFGYEMVNHVDGDKLNNNRSNLEWCDAKHNVIHARDNGLLGLSLNGNGVLSLEIVNKIREWAFYKSHYRIKDDLLFEFGITISRPNITDIINRKSYKFYFDAVTLKYFSYPSLFEFEKFKRARRMEEEWIKLIEHRSDGSVAVTLDLSTKLFKDLQDVDVPANSELMKGFKRFIVNELGDFERLVKDSVDYVIVSTKKVLNNAILITVRIN